MSLLVSSAEMPYSRSIGLVSFVSIPNCARMSSLSRLRISTRARVSAVFLTRYSRNSERPSAVLRCEFLFIVEHSSKPSITNVQVIALPIEMVRISVGQMEAELHMYAQSRRNREQSATSSCKYVLTARIGSSHRALTECLEKPPQLCWRGGPWFDHLVHFIHDV